MPEESFPHLSLRQIVKGTPRYPIPKTLVNERTQGHLDNRGEHGAFLKTRADEIIRQKELVDREREDAKSPALPESIALFLQVDTGAHYELDKLRSLGLEVICEQENGWVVGASENISLSKLSRKIELFMGEGKQPGPVAKLWELKDGTAWRIDEILSDELKEHWGDIQDDQNYIVDVSIACMGPCYSDDRYLSESRLREIQVKWDDYYTDRSDNFEEFVREYDGEILLNICDVVCKPARLPDSFSVRVKISGKGLKDIVFNHPYVFEVTFPPKLESPFGQDGEQGDDESVFRLLPPEDDDPAVCIIDSGLQEGHRLLANAIKQNASQCYLPGETDIADDVSNGGHGTRVAGAVLYPETIPHSGSKQGVAWLLNARVLDDQCRMPTALFPPVLLREIIKEYYENHGARLFNHSINTLGPVRKRRMSHWAAEIDLLCWDYDILFMQSAGNVPKNGRLALPGVVDHLQAGKKYPAYLLEDSCRITNPAQSFQALTVGSICLDTFQSTDTNSFGNNEEVSAFSRTGTGLWDTVKPDVVELGGDLCRDNLTPPGLSTKSNTCPELIRSTASGGPAYDRDAVGTSFATPKVAFIAAKLQSILPDSPAILYRALIAQSARWPECFQAQDPSGVIRMIGYGLPSEERATENNDYRVTLITPDAQTIKANEAHIYQVQLPESLSNPGEDEDILLEVTLSYKAQPRRTRSQLRGYLSTWADWKTSGLGEDIGSFKGRCLKDFGKDDDEIDSIKWFVGAQKNHGQVRSVGRSNGTLQKDWAVLKNYQLSRSFAIAVVGHRGWDNNPESCAEYCLAVSFESLGQKMKIYSDIRIENEIELETEEIELEVEGE